MRPIATLASAIVLTFAAVAVQAQGVPGVEPNNCLAGKTKCVTKKLQGLLKCREKCQKNPGKCGQAQTDCEAKVMDKFDGGAKPEKGCFAKLEAKEDLEKPKSICATTGDTSTMEARADALADEILRALEVSDPGFAFGGFYWYLGEDNQSCTEVCTGRGLAYDDDGTRGFAGSDGTTQSCHTILLALGADSGQLTEGNCGGLGGLGCVWIPDESLRARCTIPPTDPDEMGDPADDIFRACACR